MLQYIVDLSTASYFVADPVVETEDYNDLIIYITEIDNDTDSAYLAYIP